MLWPDDGTWYKGRIKKCDVADAKAIIYYAETEETEEADLQDLVKDGQIAFSERRRRTRCFSELATNRHVHLLAMGWEAMGWT